MPDPSPSVRIARHRPRIYEKMSSFIDTLRRLERQTRPSDAETEVALARRFAELPVHVRTPAQLMGRRVGGCEGTHGVFPRCNFGCRPCYHTKTANAVRIDGPHTLREVESQMRYLRERRGPGQFAQLIGGEASLLDPDDHASALEIMRKHGRVPMSFTHGDFDYAYLERLALGPDGKPRTPLLSFAAHFDTTMRGRRGIPRPKREQDLNEYRATFCAMFARLKREHGVRSYLAHNMTVTPANVGEIAGVIRDCRAMGFRMFSFQPAAYVGDERRWTEDFRSIGAEEVWSEIESGAGTRLPYRAVQMGDERCNRVTWGLYVGDRYIPILDDQNPRDLAARDAFYRAFPRNFTFASRPVMATRVVRAAAARPRDAATGARYAARLMRRLGPAAIRSDIRPVTFVMHRFMDAEDVREAWKLTKAGIVSDDPQILETQERLAACAYGMAHPESDEIVPACVQHSILDVDETHQLAQILPLRRRLRSTEPGSPDVA